MPGRRFGVGSLLAIYVLAVAYGSLLPFDFAELDRPALDEVFPSSLTDFAANILLFVPLGFLAAGSRGVEPGRKRRIGLALLQTALLCVALSAALELAQAYVPDRTVALSDIIAATMGGLLGASLWVAVGERCDEWIDGLGRSPMLAAYALVFAIATLQPLDLTADLGFLAAKYRSGRIIVAPALSSVADAGTLWLPVFAVPIGAFAAALFPRTGIWLPAFASAAGLAALELTQVFVLSRTASVLDLLLNMSGALLGAAAFTRWHASR